MKTFTIHDPSGKLHFKHSTTKDYLFAVVRQNKGDDPDHYFVNFATTLQRAQKESRVLANQRSYNQVERTTRLV
jgi:hypothetical protein